jgi:hypothetical protein
MIIRYKYTNLGFVGLILAESRISGAQVPSCQNLSSNPSSNLRFNRILYFGLLKTGFRSPVDLDSLRTVGSGMSTGSRVKCGNPWPR